MTHRLNEIVCWVKFCNFCHKLFSSWRSVDECNVVKLNMRRFSNSFIVAGSVEVLLSETKDSCNGYNSLIGH
jgi:hypothetical protein